MNWHLLPFKGFFFFPWLQLIYWKVLGISYQKGSWLSAVVTKSMKQRHQQSPVQKAHRFFVPESKGALSHVFNSADLYVSSTGCLRCLTLFLVPVTASKSVGEIQIYQKLKPFINRQRKALHVEKQMQITGWRDRLRDFAKYIWIQQEPIWCEIFLPV